MNAGSLSLSIRAADIPGGGRRFRVEADAAERRGLAEALGILDVKDLAAEFDVRPLAGGAFSVQGTLTASVVQTDVVTLEPVQQRVEETIDLTLAAAESAAPGPAEPALVESGESEGPELFRNGRIELGALTGEYLALGLDPYPRALGVEFGAHIEDDSAAAASPFAVLAKLKKGEE